MQPFCRVLLVCLLSGIVSGSARAGNGTDDEAKKKTLYNAASLRASILYHPNRMMSITSGVRSQDKMRSIPLAFGLSAVVPGLGQFYNGQWTKGIVSIAIEAAVMTGYLVYRKRGLDGEAAFERYANRLWDPLRYATWLNDYTVFLRDEFGNNVTAPPVQLVQGIDFQNPNSWSAADRATVSSFFSQIRAIERQVFHPETGAAFSHQLPRFGDQQYYELIGKYFQFAPGWTDYPSWFDENGNFTGAIDPEKTAADGSKPNVSDNFFKYADDAARAEDLLRDASKISLLFIVNHLLASVDAAVNAKLHNDRISTQVGFAYSRTQGTVPVATMRIRL
jgi:TM2 domain-containing membrane protein YozV